MTLLYHGSNVEIKEIDLSKGKRGKDFGKGFYLNADRKQAFGMAQKTFNLLGSGSPVISCFEFDENLIEKYDLKVKIFNDYSVEWAEFVVMNRKNNTDVQAHPYDIVIGPIADDTVGVQIRRYTMGYLSANNLVEELRYRGNHAKQYFFGTEKAIKILKKITL